MIRRLIVVRHGETIHNAGGVTQGWCDSELSVRGVSQVEAAARRIRRYKPAAIYCSTLPRAITTAEMIAREVSLLPLQLEDLREMHCGRWEGMEFLALREAEGELYRRWVADPAVPCPEGESLVDVSLRVDRALAQIDEAVGDDVTVVIVSHGTAIRVMATRLLALPLEAARSFVQDNAAVNVFDRREDRYVLRLWNDTTHCELID